jgi:putative ABC transport system permease protein
MTRQTPARQEADRRSGIRFARLVEEAAAGVMSRPARSIVSVLGTALGIGSFIAVLGLISTANGQIDKQFNDLVATQITVNIASSTGDPTDELAPQFPSDAERGVERLDGVIHAGVGWGVSGVATSRLPPGFDAATESQLRIFAATPGIWKVVHPSIVDGRVFDNALRDQPVAVLGSQIATALGLPSDPAGSTIYLGGHSFTVIGVVDRTSRLSDPLSSITIPASVATQYFGPPGTNAQMTVQTRLGANATVARQVPLAIDPTRPSDFQVQVPPDPQVVRNFVSSSLSSLFLALAVICVLIGSVGIANANLTGVMARVPEIGLRRALGAKRMHIAEQFLIESAILGAFGGLCGGCIGLISVVAVSFAQHWTPVVSPTLQIASPIAGALLGIVAGLYPSMRAARIEPIEAFRR